MLPDRYILLPLVRVVDQGKSSFLIVILYCNLRNHQVFHEEEIDLRRNLRLIIVTIAKVFYRGLSSLVLLR